MPRPALALLRADRKDSSRQMARLLRALPVHPHLPQDPLLLGLLSDARLPFLLPALASPSPPLPGRYQSHASVPRPTVKPFLTFHSGSHPTSLGLPFQS